MFTVCIVVTVLVADIFSPALDFIRYKPILTGMSRS